MLLQFGDLCIFQGYKAISLDCVPLQSSSQLLKGSCRDAENRQVLRELIIVSDLLVRVKISLIFLDSKVLVKPVYFSH